MRNYDLILDGYSFTKFDNMEYIILNYETLEIFQMFFNEKMVFKGISLTNDTSNFKFKILNSNIYYKAFLSLLGNRDNITIKNKDNYILFEIDDNNSIIITIHISNKEVSSDYVFETDLEDENLLKFKNDINAIALAYSKIDRNLTEYINKKIITRYDSNKIKHVSFVLRRMMDICIQNNMDDKINYNMIYIIAIFHDIAYKNQLEHASLSANILLEDAIIKNNFSSEQISIMENAIKYHNSLESIDDNIYLKILKMANKEIHLDEQVINSYNYLLLYLEKNRGEVVYDLNDIKVKIKEFLINKYHYLSEETLEDSEYTSRNCKIIEYIQNNDIDELIDKILLKQNIKQKRSF